VRAWVWIAACGALAALGGCAVGSGSGSATGSLFVIGCNDGANFGSTETDGGIAPRPYDMQPSFFAGVPNEGTQQGQDQMNEIAIRMQSSGLSIMYTDTLYFTVINSFQVARCVRGRTVNGQPDWNVTEPLPASLGTATNDPNPSTDWCDWSATAFTDGGLPDGATAGAPDAGASLDGGMSVMAQYPRIHLTPYTDVHSSIALNAACPGANVTADAIDGWIEFQNFGSAEEPNSPPEARMPVPANFVINFGDRLRASFHVVLQDSRFSYAIENNMPIPTTSHMEGTLDGYFDFDLERGRAAQPFP
jgi:hypothetical protein